MSDVRVHNFSISLDGFGTGDGITFEATKEAVRLIRDWPSSEPKRR